MGRIEHDLLGTLEIPEGVLYGIHTQRARLNFDAAHKPVHAVLIAALAQVKLACARTNLECGFLEPTIDDAITTA